MNNNKSHYISFRVACMFVLLGVIATIYIILFTILAVSKGQYLWLAAIGYISVGICFYICYHWVYKAYKENSKVLQLFSTGYTFDGIFKQRIYLSPDIKEAIMKFREVINTGELINATKKQAEFLALQNQINPHFLYNTLEGIRGETLSAGLDSVADMMEALATFFRYTISNIENLATLEDELSNIENYYIIQQYRFGERLKLDIEYDSNDEIELFKYRLPRLTLQPIVENSIYHGIERKVGKGCIKVKIENTSNLLIITISDNGLGMSAERLEELNYKLNNSSFDYIKSDREEKGGIAIVNVNNRIKLMFGEEYGICIYSTLNVGTDVEVTLPLIKNNKKGY